MKEEVFRPDQCVPFKEIAHPKNDNSGIYSPLCFANLHNFFLTLSDTKGVKKPEMSYTIFNPTTL